MSEAVLSPDTDDFWKAVESQREAATPKQSAWVAANAGSGKTRVLVDRVARLLLQGAEPDSLLCVTYTKAAANEMLDRLFGRLGAWSTMETEPLRKELVRLEGDHGQIYSDDQLRRARALFARALETPGGLRIETIHAFCSRILRRFPLEAGVPPGFREIEDEEADEIWRRAVTAAVLDADPDALDRVALEGGGRGAEEGLSRLRAKRSEIARFADAFGDDLDAMTDAVRAWLGAPEESVADILARAMSDELPMDALKETLGVLTVGAKTDAATAEKLEIALSNAPDLERWADYRSIFMTQTGEWRKSNPYTQKSAGIPVVPELFQMKDGEGTEVSRVKEIDAVLKAAEAVERTRALLAVGLPAIRRYRAEKRARAALDFDDLIRSAHDLLSDPGSAQWALYKIDGGLTHVLLDEAQDTSPDQWALIHSLTEEFFAGKGAEREQEPRTLFVVGDEKQSIYSFQGAAPEKFHGERQAFQARCAAGEIPFALPEMAMSFRSSPEVLAFVDTVFDTDAFEGPPFSLDAPAEDDVIHHDARRANQPGFVTLLPLEPPEEEEDADPWDAPMDAASASSPKARLAARLASDIKAMIDAGETVWAEQADGAWARRAMRPEDVLILVRGRTGGLFDALIRALKEQDLPVAGADRLKLADHIGVQDCLNLMRFALLPEDDLILAEILRGPFCNLVDDDIHLFPLAYGRGGASLWSRLLDENRPPYAEARAFCLRLLDMAHLPPFEFLSTILETPVFGDETGWDRIGKRLGAPARDPVEALLSRALAHDARSAGTLQTFVAELDGTSADIKRDLAAPNGAIRVMTVHGAKGLQAPVVFLPDTTAPLKASGEAVFVRDGVPVWSPNKAADTSALAAERELSKHKDLLEHRRLLYVALTRAQDRLIIAGAWNNQHKETGRPDKSWYALCEAAMNRLGHDADGETPLMHGAPPLRAVPWAAREMEKSAPEWLRKAAPASASADAPLAPSAFIADTSQTVAPLTAERSKRLARGRAIHKLFERLPALPREARGEAAETYLAALPDFDDEDRAEMARAVFGVLDDPAFAAIFDTTGRSEVSIVGRVEDLAGRPLINGVVDRLLVSDEEILIIDFKTDRPAPDDASGVGEAYVAQMAAYRAVLARAYPDRPVKCALVWTDGPKLMPLPEPLLLDALNRVGSAL